MHKKKIHEIPTTCDKCGLDLKTETALKHHLATIHSENVDIIVCKVCGKKFYTERQIYRHMQTHEEKAECPICHKRFRELRQHIETSHMSDEERKYQCKTCGKGFISLSYLKSHNMNVHLKLRPYECRYGCELRYNDSANRNAHEKKKHGGLFANNKISYTVVS